LLPSPLTSGVIYHSRSYVATPSAPNPPNVWSKPAERTREDSSTAERQDYGVMKDKIRNELKRFIQKSTSRRPLIMPVIMEI